MEAEKYGSCHGCQNQGVLHCAHPKECGSANEYPIILRDMFKSDYEQAIPISQTAEKAYDIGYSNRFDTAIEFADWLANNWIIPSIDGLWKLDTEHIEYQRTLPEKDVDLYTTEELITLFRTGHGEF